MRTFVKTFLVVLTAMCLIPIDSAFANRVHGVFKVVKGKVKIKTSKGKTKRARIGQKVYPKDTIITGKNSRAKVVMIDKNVINVSPDSEILFENYEYDPAKKKKDVLLNVIYGKVRSKVNQRYNGKTSKFQVKTPSAVAGVRGTDFFTAYSSKTGATQVITFEGRVEYGLPGANGSILNAVSVSAGQMATAKRGAPPQRPVSVPKNQLANLDTSSDADKAPDIPTKDARQPANGETERKGQEQNPEGAENKGPAIDQNPEAEAKGPQPGEGKRPNTANNDGINVDGSAAAPGSVIGGVAGSEGSLPNLDKGPNAENRAPANFAPPAGADGTMLLPGDIVGGPGAGEFPTVGDVLGENFVPPEVIDTNFDNIQDVIPNCEFCDETVESGTTKLTIIINN